jgi:N-acetylmuramoyl-L-alanine amidase
MAQTTVKRKHPISPKRKKRRLIIGASSGFILIIIIILLVFGGGKKGGEQNPENTGAPVNELNPEASPTPTADITPEPTAASGPLICIDPGHGYSDGGSESAYLSEHNMTEKDINLPVALKVRDILVEHGYNVIMTRDSDIIPEGADDDNDGFYIVQTEDIAKFANDMNADYFFSIHCDSYPDDESVSGTRFYYYKNGAGKPKEWVTAIADGFRQTTGIEPKIIEKTDSDYVQNILKLANNTAGYVELGFISNKEDADSLASPEYQAKLAEGIAAGIMSYIPLE